MLKVTFHQFCIPHNNDTITQFIHLMDSWLLASYVDRFMIKSNENQETKNIKFYTTSPNLSLLQLIKITNDMVPANMHHTTRSHIKKITL